MNIKEQIAVMQHFDNGGSVESCYKGDDMWVETTDPSWNFGALIYRVSKAPKPDRIGYDFVRPVDHPYCYATIDEVRVHATACHIVKMIFDGETGALKECLPVEG